MVSLRNLADRIHNTAKMKGFWKAPTMMDVYVAKICLIISEGVEIMEALRKDQGAQKVTEEFADLFIRALDVHHTLAQAGLADPNLELAIQSKMEKNDRRPVMHGHRWG